MILHFRKEQLMGLEPYQIFFKGPSHYRNCTRMDISKIA
jgi:hypothetical protein